MTAHDHDVGRFDEWAATYDRHWMQRFLFDPVQKTVVELAATEVAHPAAILDVGCGTGRLLRRAAERFREASLEGIDAAPAMVAQAKSNVGGESRLHSQQATAEALPFADDTFDLVFSTLTFHHWSDQNKGIAEVGRVLKPGGRWLLADFISSGLAALVLRTFEAHRFPRRRALDAMLAACGMEVVAHRHVWRTLGNVPVLAIAAQRSKVERAMGIEPT